MEQISSPTIVFWFLLAFLLGSIPFSVLLGKITLHTDIRKYGDHNPGAANVWRAGGKILGIIAILLDGFKGAIPVGIANFVIGIQGPPLVAIALAPIYGHAFSPFLRFRGGKALSVTFGVWLGLTFWVGPVVLGCAFAVWLAILVVPGWAVLMGMLSLIAFFIGIKAPQVLLIIWLGNLIVLLWKHHGDLRQPPQLSNGILRSIFKK